MKPHATLPPGIRHDPTATGHDRYTHDSTGRAIVRQPHMTDAQWDWAVGLFFDAHSGPITRFRSVAVWPRDSVDHISLGNTANESADTHESEAAALAVCCLLRRRGFGGMGRTLPAATRVEEIDQAGNVVRIVEEWPRVRG